MGLSSHGQCAASRAFGPVPIFRIGQACCIHSCWFDMHEANYRPISCFDTQTGELTLRCMDGLVNNFNETILDCIRYNMDIKFVGSGASTKAILYYITDYITKSQLKTHVACAALELAIA